MRVKLKIKGSEAEVVTSALVNSGFETDEPEIILPPSLAEILSLRGVDVSEYRVAGGGGTSGVRIRGKLKVKIMLGDRETGEVEAVGTILPGEDEVIISDRLASELKIVILNPYKGSWCLIDELGEKVRETAKIEIWK